MKKIILVLILKVFFAGAIINTVFAHEHNEEDWSPVSAGPVTTWTAPVCGKGKFVLQPFFFYNRARGTFNNEGHYDSLSGGEYKYQLQQQIFAQYGLTDRLEIDGQTVYQENFRRQNDTNARDNGFGDSYGFLRYCFFEETDTLPHTAGLFQLKIPTGKYEGLGPNKLGTDAMGATSGGGSWDHGYGINLSKKVKPFVFHADAIYSFPQEVRVDGVDTKYGKYLNYDFGLEYFLPAGFNLMLEFNGFLQGDKKENGTKTPASDINYLTASPGIGWSNEKVQTLLAYQRTLTGTNTDANDSVVLTFVYTF